MKEELNLDIIEQSSFYKRYGYKMHWVSGSATVVYPITYWNTGFLPNIEIQLESYNNKGIMQSAKKLSKIMEKEYDCKVEIQFCKYDGSCPNVMKFILI